MRNLIACASERDVERTRECLTRIILNKTISLPSGVKGALFVVCGLLWTPIGIFLCVIALVPVACLGIFALAYGYTQQYARSAFSIAILASIFWIYNRIWKYLKRHRRWQEYRTDF